MFSYETFILVCCSKLFILYVIIRISIIYFQNLLQELKPLKMKSRNNSMSDVCRCRRIRYNLNKRSMKILSADEYEAASWKCFYTINRKLWLSRADPVCFKIMFNYPLSQARNRGNIFAPFVLINYRNVCIRFSSFFLFFGLPSLCHAHNHPRFTPYKKLIDRR